MPKEAFYFSHDSNARTDEKILKLRYKHGWNGYGIYWALIEMLRDSSSYELELNFDLIAFELRTEHDTIKSIVLDFGLFDLNETHFFSISLKRRMELKESKSEQARDAARKRWAKQAQSGINADALPTQSERNAIKEKKEKKEKKEIPKENDHPFKVDFTIEAFKTDKANEAWVEWLQHKVEQGEPINRKRQEYVKKDLKAMASHDGQLIESIIPPIIAKCIAMGWKNLQTTEEMKAKIKNHVRVN